MGNFVFANLKLDPIYFSKENYMNISRSISLDKLWCITGDNLDCQSLSGWTFSGDFIWPDTDTLYISM